MAARTTTSRPALRARLRGRLRRAARAVRLRASLRHVHGPARFPADGAPAVICLIRNGRYYLDPFFAHHRALGVERFVFVDNGSDDGTRARIAAEPGTAILSSALSAGRFENALREAAARRYCTGGWCLFVDSDELFDFPGSARIGIEGLVGYLEAHGQTGLVAQMLEMVPRGPLRDHAHLPYEAAIAAFDHYDISCVRSLPYHSPEPDFAALLATNVPASEDVRILYGGVRARVFGEACCLTKHPLVRVAGATVPGRHPHCSTHLRVTEVTGLIRHYKFANDPAARDAANVAAGLWSHGEDRRRMGRFAAEPDLSLDGPEARPFRGPEALVEAGFLTSSPAYARWVEMQANPHAGRPT